MPKEKNYASVEFHGVTPEQAQKNKSGRAYSFQTLMKPASFNMKNKEGQEVLGKDGKPTPMVNVELPKNIKCDVYQKDRDGNVTGKFPDYEVGGAEITVPSFNIKPATYKDRETGERKPLGNKSVLYFNPDKNGVMHDVRLNVSQKLEDGSWQHTYLFASPKDLCHAWTKTERANDKAYKDRQAQKDAPEPEPEHEAPMPAAHEVPLYDEEIPF